MKSSAHTHLVVVEHARSLWKRMETANTFGLAAQVAFWLFLSLLPLAAVAGLVVSRLALSHGAFAVNALATLPTAVRTLVTTELAHVANWNGGAVGPVATVMFAWLASGGVHSVFDALEIEVRVARPWWQKRLLAIAACAALSVGAAVIGVLATCASWAWRLADGALPRVIADATFAFAALRMGAGALIAVALVAGVYWVGTPPAARKCVPVLPGAILAVVFGGACGWGYGVYLGTFGLGEGYSAGLAVIGVALTYLYLLAIGFLAGASLNQVLARPSAVMRSVPLASRLDYGEHHAHAHAGATPPSHDSDPLPSHDKGARRRFPGAARP